MFGSFMEPFSYHCGLCLSFVLALEVTQRIMENDDWSSLFKPSDFFQKYKYVMCTDYFSALKSHLKDLAVQTSTVTCLYLSNMKQLIIARSSHVLHFFTILVLVSVILLDILSMICAARTSSLCYDTGLSQVSQ